MKYICVMCGTESEGAQKPIACAACGAEDFTCRLESVTELIDSFTKEHVLEVCAAIDKRMFSLEEFMQIFTEIMKLDDAEKEALTDVLCDLVRETGLFDALAKKNGVFRDIGRHIRHAYRDANKTPMICDCMVLAEFARKRRMLQSRKGT